MTFAQRLQSAMEAKDLNQTALSNLTGIGKPSLSQYLSGKNEPRGAVKAKLEAALGAKLDDAAPEASKPYRFSDKKITLRQAAKIMGIGAQRLAEMMEAGKIDIGIVDRGKTGKRTIYISPIKFYDLTGWRE